MYKGLERQPQASRAASRLRRRRAGRSMTLCMYIYMCIHLFSYIYMSVYLYICLRMCVYRARAAASGKSGSIKAEEASRRALNDTVYVFIHICIFIYISLYIYISIYLYIHIYVCACVYKGLERRPQASRAASRRRRRRAGRSMTQLARMTSRGVVGGSSLTSTR